MEAETPKDNDPSFRRVTHVLCATNRIALDAAACAARLLGYEPVVIAAPLTGECRDAASQFCLRLKGLRRGTPRCVIGGGETTVTLGGSYGKGGRNQEFALASAFVIEEMENAIVASCGTDGTDGPTDAAGAIVDHSTLARARDAGLDPREALEDHNAYPLFERLDDLIVTGPTNTNVMDIQIGIVAT
jgi:hydroxypyruvate reductase